jgi:hypothetical protein
VPAKNVVVTESDNRIHSVGDDTIGLNAEIHKKSKCLGCQRPGRITRTEPACPMRRSTPLRKKMVIAHPEGCGAAAGTELNHAKLGAALFPSCIGCGTAAVSNGIPVVAEGTQGETAMIDDEDYFIRCGIGRKSRDLWRGAAVLALPSWPSWRRPAGRHPIDALAISLVGIQNGGAPRLGRNGSNSLYTLWIFGRRPCTRV